jgi:hypothetical protein
LWAMYSRCAKGWESNEMGTAKYVRLATADDGESCDRCGLAVEVCAISLVREVDGGSPDGTVDSVKLCSLCLAEAVGKVTGFAAKSQLVHWRETRANSKRARAANS